MSGYRTNGSARCPACLTKLSAATGLRPTGGPRPGDVSVCVYCGIYLEFNSDLTVSTMTDEQFAALPQDSQHQLTNARLTIGMLSALEQAWKRLRLR